jgi:hypothetical protein
MSGKDEPGRFFETAEQEREYLVVEPDPSLLEKALEIAGWVAVPALFLGKHIYDLYKKGGLPPVASVNSQIANQLDFPQNGFPANGILYRRHPYVETSYIEVAEYSPYLFKAKISECARILIAAGATAFDINASTAIADKLALNAAVTLGKEFGASFKSEHKGAMKFTWSFRGIGGAAGTLPQNLAFFNHEPEWQVIWDTARDKRGGKHQLQILQDLKHEIDAKLVADFKNAGFQIGGQFKEVGTSKLYIDVTFGK